MAGTEPKEQCDDAESLSDEFKFYKFNGRHHPDSAGSASLLPMAPFSSVALITARRTAFTPWDRRGGRELRMEKNLQREFGEREESLSDVQPETEIEV